MAIKNTSGGGGVGSSPIMNSKAIKVGAGFLTGGPMGAASALNPNIGTVSSLVGGGGKANPSQNASVPNDLGNTMGSASMNPEQSEYSQTGQMDYGGGTQMGPINRRLAGMGYGQNNGY